jgi:hypothetical protein
MISSGGRKSGSTSSAPFCGRRSLPTTTTKRPLDDISKYLKLDRALIKKAYYEGYLDQTSDPNVTGIVRFWKIMLKSDFIESDKDITKFIDTKVYENALNKWPRKTPVTISGRSAWKPSPSATQQPRRRRLSKRCRRSPLLVRP